MTTAQQACYDEHVSNPVLGPSPITPERKYANHTDEGLLAVNRQYVREYRADPTPERLQAINESGHALEARGL